MKIACPEHLNDATGRELLESIDADQIAETDTVTLDFSHTKTISSTGGAWLIRLATVVQQGSATLKLEGATDHVAEFLRFIEPGFDVRPGRKLRHASPLERIGASTISVAIECREFLAFTIDAIYWSFLALFDRRGFRWKSMLDELHEMGVRAIGIVFLMNFLLGLIIAMLSAAQLEDFGAVIFVADLVVIAFARELAAVMTATVVSARTGAAIAAELATMKVQEEIDSLRAMGLNVSQFLVAPKMIALLIALPCLVALGMVAGMLGGSTWGILVMGIDMSQWSHELFGAVRLSDLCQGMSKAVIFALVIVLIGCHNGLRVEGGSRGVGLVTTRAVVMDIFALITIDVAFAAIFYYVF